jgi:hypothetical protein
VEFIVWTFFSKMFTKEQRYQMGNQKLLSEEGHTTQLSKEKAQKYKQ